MEQSSEEERKDFFESAKRKAEADVKRNPRDTGALTRWGGALLELANFMPAEEASDMVDAAVQKFHQALKMDPKKHDALWCLGNAYTSQGFLSSQRPVAEDLFRKAEKCFKDALAEQPENPIYKKGLEMTNKAPELYDEIQKQIAQPSGPPGMGGGGADRSAGGRTSVWFDVLGYATVIGLIVGVSALVSVLNPPPQGSAAAPQPPAQPAPAKKA